MLTLFFSMIMRPRRFNQRLLAQFSKIWGSDNKGKFVKVTSNDFTNAATTTFVRRLVYPSVETSRNGANVPAIDDNTLRLWWDE